MNLLKCEIEKKGLPGAESQRLFHGRGHCFPGYEDVLIDWFSPVVLVTLYRDRPEGWIEELATWIKQYLTAEAVVVQKRYLPHSPSSVIAGELPDNVNAIEAGLNYRLRLNDAQNIGFFLDMAVGRTFVRQNAEGKKILNLFSYSCSFSVAAIAGGADNVVNIDMNRGALALGRSNHQLNHLDLRRVSFLPLEIFRSFSRLRKLAPFDMIICDPPDEQGSSFRPQRDWPKLARKLPGLLSENGEILFCLSSPRISTDDIKGLFQKVDLPLQWVDTYRSEDDFPEAEPEKGLNILHYRKI